MYICMHIGILAVPFTTLLLLAPESIIFFVSAVVMGTDKDKNLILGLLVPVASILAYRHPLAGICRYYT